MNSLWVVVIGVVVIYLAYNFYAKRIDRSHPGGSEASDPGEDVHGWCGFHAHQP
jgi:hypothetical protein